jgi:hypothetical protein
MPVGNDPIKVVANQMMKGPKNARYAPGSTEKSREEFAKKHEELIAKILKRMPQSRATVVAVICKCALKYGEEKAIKLADCLKAGTFNGANDPAHLLWQFIHYSRGKNTTNVYRHTVCAARAFCEGRTLTHLRPSESDIA